MMRVSFEAMDLDDLMTHIKFLPVRDIGHQLGWAVQRGVLTRDMLDSIKPEAWPFVTQVLENPPLTPLEAVLAKMGQDFGVSAPFLTDEQVKAVTRVMYRTLYIGTPRLDKTEWTAFLVRLHETFDPANLTRMGLSQEGHMQARLSVVWTEEAARIVLRLNNVLDDLDGMKGQRGPGTALHESPCPRDLNPLGSYDDEALEQYACPPWELEVKWINYSQEGKPRPHCVLCMVAEFARLDPRLVSQIAQSVDERQAHMQQYEAMIRQYGWEEDEDDCCREDD